VTCHSGSLKCFRIFIVDEMFGTPYLLPYEFWIHSSYDLQYGIISTKYVWCQLVCNGGVKWGDPQDAACWLLQHGVSWSSFSYPFTSFPSSIMCLNNTVFCCCYLSGKFDVLRATCSPRNVQQSSWTYHENIQLSIYMLLMQMYTKLEITSPKAVICSMRY
jgi:hypothetical protein